jgi:hypothetical protein
MSNPLRNTLILGNLTITGWTAKKKAKGVEKKAEAENGAVDGSISARKALLPGAQALDAIANYGANCRGWWIANSREWLASARVYHAAKHFDIQTEIGDRQRAYYALVDTFMQEYPQLRSDAQFQLNHLFDSADYPEPWEVRAKFRFDFEVSALPAGEDIRLLSDVISTDEAERLVFEAEARTEARVKEAMRSVYTDLHGVVSHYVARMKARDESEEAAVPGSKTRVSMIHETVITNILDLVDRMPGLNLTGDTKLAELAAEAHSLATFATVDELKESSATRALATQKAEKISAMFKEMFA